MRIRISIITALFLIGLNINTHAQTIEESLDIAIENNPLLKAKYTDFKAAIQKVAQVNSLPDPTLSFGYFVSPVETRVGPQQVRLGLSQMFPWFGSLRTAGNVQALQAEAKYQEFLYAKNDLIMQVKSAWYRIYEVNQKILLQQENKKILISYKKLATASYKNDKGGMIDVIRADLMIDNTNTDVQLLQDNLEPLIVHFNQLLNRADSTGVDVGNDLDIVQVPLRYRRDSLLSNHPLLQSLNLKINSAQAAQELSRKQGMPKFGVGLDYVFVAERTDVTVPDNGKNAIMPMVSMSIPIYRGKYKAAVKEAQLRQEAIEYQKTSAENTLKTNYEAAWYELERARQLVQLYDTQISKSKLAISLLETAYSNSGQDFEEILRLQQDILKYSIATKVATTEFYVALAKLDYLTSKSN